MRDGGIDTLSAFCWSKVGAEAGEGLAQIVLRKEMERRAQNGLFVWGIGTSLGKALLQLREVVTSAHVLFSQIRSNPKAADLNPSRVHLWLSYEDDQGGERPLPLYSLVTSRGVTGSERSKTVHYALVCRSEDPISTGPIGMIDASRLRNLVSGRPLGSSQVTAAVTLQQKSGGPSKPYTVSFGAELADPFQIKLAQYRVVESSELLPAFEAARAADVLRWQGELRRLKQSNLDR